MAFANKLLMCHKNFFAYEHSGIMPYTLYKPIVVHHWKDAAAGSPVIPILSVKSELQGSYLPNKYFMNN